MEETTTPRSHMSSTEKTRSSRRAMKGGPEAHWLPQQGQLSLLWAADPLGCEAGSGRPDRRPREHIIESHCHCNSKPHREFGNAPP